MWTKHNSDRSPILLWNYYVHYLLRPLFTSHVRSDGTGIIERNENSDTRVVTKRVPHTHKHTHPPRPLQQLTMWWPGERRPRQAGQRQTRQGRKNGQDVN